MGGRQGGEVLFLEGGWGGCAIVSGRWGEYKADGGREVGGVDEVWLGWEALVSVFVGCRMVGG